MKPDLKEVNDKEFDRVMKIVQEIGTSERHFNMLEGDYRKLSSTWLLAALGACGYVIKSEASMPFDKWYLVFGICIAASIGIGVLWMLDIKVYHRLLHSFFKEGVRMETTHTWLSPIRINMVRSQKSGDIVTRVQYYYFASIMLLMILSVIALWNFESLANDSLLKSILTMVVPGSMIVVFILMMKKPSQKSEVLLMVEEYDRENS